MSIRSEKNERMVLNNFSKKISRKIKFRRQKFFLALNIRHYCKICDFLLTNFFYRRTLITEI